MSNQIPDPVAGSMPPPGDVFHPDHAEKERRESLSQAIIFGGFESEKTARELLNYALHLAAEKRLVEAAQLLEKRLAIQQKRHHSAHRLAATCEAIVGFLSEAGHSKEAANWTARAKSLRRPSVEDRKHRHDIWQASSKGSATQLEIATLHAKYAEYLQSQGRSLEAAQQLEEKLQIQRGLNEDAAERAETCDAIALCFFEAGRLDESRDWTQRSHALKNPSELERVEREYLERSKDQAHAQFNFAGFLRANRRALEAAQLLEQRLALQVKQHQPLIDRAQTCDVIATSLREAGRPGTALWWTVCASTLRKR